MSKVFYLPSSFRRPSTLEELKKLGVLFGASVNVCGAVFCAITTFTTSGNVRMAAIAGVVGFSIGAVTLFRDLSRK